MTGEGCGEHLDAVLDNGVCLVCSRIERDEACVYGARPPRWLLAALWLYDRLRGRR